MKHVIQWLSLVVFSLDDICLSTTDPFMPISSQRSTAKIFRYTSARAFQSQGNTTNMHLENGHSVPHDISSFDIECHQDNGPLAHIPVFMLDLDETCLFGNDGNDLGIALQCMGHTQYLDELYRLIINPALRPAYDAFRSFCQRECSSDLEPRVVIYTARISLLFYVSEFRPKPVALRQAA